MALRRIQNYFSKINRQIFHFAPLLFILCCIVSCQNNGDKKVTKPEGKTVKPPLTVIAKQPRAISLSAYPKPKTIAIPAKPTTYILHTERGDVNTVLSPPETKPAGFLLHMENYNTDNGLVLDAIASSYMDHLGNLWFGSQGGGVSRYDGKSFTNFTMAQGLSNNNVYSILEDKKGNLWFGTDGGGVCRYDGRCITSYSTAQGFGYTSVWSMLEDKKGNIWFGTGGGGVSCYDGKKFTTYTIAQGLCNNDILSILEDRNGDLWFGSQGGGVSRYDGKTFTNYTSEQGLSNNTVSTMVEDRAGNIWFGTNSGMLSRYDGKSFTTYVLGQKLMNNPVVSSIRDRKGNLWFGLDGGIVSCYDGKDFTNYSSEQGFPDNTVETIIEDKAGSLWFGTSGGGVSRYDGKSFSSYTMSQGMGNNIVFSILEDKKGKLWFGTEGGGMSCYDGKSFTSYTISQGLNNNNIFSIMQDRKGNLWFGTQGGGVSCFDGKSFTTYGTEQGLGNGNVWSILEDKEGNFWFGTEGGGVSKLDSNSLSTYTTENGLPDNSVTLIMEDKKSNLWFGTHGSGTACYDGKTFTVYRTEQGLPNNIVSSILEDKTGNLWFGTDGGLSRFDGKTFLNYSTEQGLPDNGAASIVADNQGSLVIGTNFGIAILKGYTKKLPDKIFPDTIPVQNNMSNEELESYTPVFKIHNSKTGDPVKDVNGGSDNGAMLCDSKGIIWVGTGSEKTALVRFDPAALNKTTNLPKVVLQNVKINEENICWYTIIPPGLKNIPQDSLLLAQQELITYGKTLNTLESDTMRKKFSGIQFDGITPFYPLPQNLVLPYQYNHITFEFAAIEPVKPYLVKYQYILENYSKDWSPATNKSMASFGNIDEGTYTFKVRAQSPDGIWSDPVIYTFKVLPPLYRTWWAYTSYVLIAFLLLFGIYRWRTAALRKEKVVLEQTVQQRTMEVVKQKDEAEKHRAEAEEQKILVEEKNKDITDSINYAKRIQQALLKEEEYVTPHLPDHFILFKPKDIVSGDFYWSIEKDEYFYLAAVDCTGHGVPGGFMSMLGLAFLNELTSGVGILTPAEILDKLRDKILKEFKQTGTDSETKDGMDISLMRMNLKTMEILWSGANNPLYITDGELKEISPDKQPIGYYPLMKPFSNHSIKAEKDSILYLFSDGYCDQFGGPKGKKFKHSGLKELLQSIHGKSMREQKKILNDTFETWKGHLEQVDDVLVIGIKV